MSNFTDSLRIGQAGTAGDPSLRKFPGASASSCAIGSNFGGFTSPPHQVYTYGAPATKNATNIATAQAITTNLSASINGALATAGVATIDVERCVALLSSNAGDTTQTATVAGTDLYGVPLTSAVTMTGTAAVNTTKGFKTVTAVTLSTSLAGNLSVGTSDVFGLPYYQANQDGLIVSWAGFPATSGTFKAGDTTAPATVSTSDVRGSFAPASASNGTNRLAFYVTPQVVPYPNEPTRPGFDSITTLYGVPQV